MEGRACRLDLAIAVLTDGTSAMSGSMRDAEVRVSCPHHSSLVRKATDETLGVFLFDGCNLLFLGLRKE